MSMTIQSSVKDKILATSSETSTEYEYEISYHPGKANVVTDALSRKERVKPRRVRAMAMTIQYGVPLVESEMDEAHASRSPVLWAKIVESSLIGPELVQETTDKVVLIKEKLKAARDHLKTYADNRRKPLEFEVGDRVMLKVSLGSVGYEAVCFNFRLSQSIVKDKDIGYFKQASTVEKTPAKKCKANVVTDALSRKERVKPRRVRAMAMTIQYGVRGMILTAQSEAFKQENRKVKWVKALCIQGKVIATMLEISELVLRVKAAMSKTFGLLQQLKYLSENEIESSWILSLNFQGQSSEYDVIWVMVDRLTKLAYFLAIQEISRCEVGRIYIDEIIARNWIY
ncbi:hypothetical protein Tco_0803659 [Tanacetum coccineum]|uniref:Reverse transcriptase domain-containing protein n=1 Tax=Tanacetum coccineum TaxID=301880 RepID=A0ABQ5A4Y0_9ASTR